MSGTVGLAVNDMARYSFFAACLTGLHHPPNTQVRWAFGSDRARGRNNLVRESLENGSEWLLFLDDDHAFPPDILNRLLAHRLPIVGGLYLQRMMPFWPVAYTDLHEDGSTTALFLPDYPADQRLVEVRGCGTGGMLIRSEVFRAIEDPWFENGRNCSEDMVFCEKARDAGFPISVDVSARLGHITTAIVWPESAADGWNVGVVVADKLTLSVPIGSREQLAEMDRIASGEQAEAVEAVGEARAPEAVAV